MRSSKSGVVAWQRLSQHVCKAQGSPRGLLGLGISQRLDQYVWGWGLNGCVWQGQGLVQHPTEPGQGLSCVSHEARAKGGACRVEARVEGTVYQPGSLITQGKTVPLLRTMGAWVFTVRDGRYTFGRGRLEKNLAIMSWNWRWCKFMVLIYRHRCTYVCLYAHIHTFYVCWKALKETRAPWRNDWIQGWSKEIQNEAKTSSVRK